MRIRSSSPSKADSKKAEGAGPVRNDGGVRQAQTDAVPVSGEDTVATGSQGELVSHAMGMGAGGRAERIDELKLALASGNYQVDAAEVSRAVVAEALVKDKE